MNWFKTNNDFYKENNKALYDLTAEKVLETHHLSVYNVV